MSWTRYLMHDFWTAQEFNRMERTMSRRRRAESRGRLKLNDRMDELEDDLGRMALLCRALAEICIKKGLLTHNDIAAMVGEMDMADGVQDGKLDPKKIRPARPGKGKP